MSTRHFGSLKNYNDFSTSKFVNFYAVFGLHFIVVLVPAIEKLLLAFYLLME